MKDVVIDLHVRESNKGARNGVTDYRKSKEMGLPARFLFECSIKLNQKPLTSAMAAIVFHRFFKEADKSDYDEFLIAASALYLAGKLKDDPVKIRDVINVTHNTLNRGATPLELDDEYWAMRDAIVQAELLITRMLKFDLSTVHPHKYMLHYMKSLQGWLGTPLWNATPIAKTSAAFLQDFHHSPEILNYKPAHIAICCLSLAMQTYGVQVPLTNESDENTNWYHAFVNDLSKAQHWELSEKILKIYETTRDESKYY
ncbi:cyclin-Q [Phlebotomus argentipes]|uniref:cyclin-Q n=1 Tax=Phlebotomus argentipes TaxID=94469 RepID=UPI0028934221|nr:cyclin-Q [Phlebotomus argentipes]